MCSPDSCPFSSRAYTWNWVSHLPLMSSRTIGLNSGQWGSVGMTYNTLKPGSWGTWVAQSVERPTLAQVMILWFVSSSPVSSSVLTAQSLEPASDSLSPSLSAPPLLVLSLSKTKKPKNKTQNLAPNSPPAWGCTFSLFPYPVIGCRRYSGKPRGWWRHKMEACWSLKHCME